MNHFERLENSRPDINVKYALYPSKHWGGCCIGNNVYINSYLSAPEQYQTLQEEVAHFDYTVGDIVKENDRSDRQQEKQARSIAMERTVTLDGIIYCYQHSLWEPEEMADYFGVTIKYLYSAIDNYREKNGLIFNYKNYKFNLTNGIILTRRT